MKSELDILKGIHPGIVLEQKLKERNQRKGKFALSIGEYPQTLGAVIKGRRNMNISLALKIEERLGLEEGFFMTLQVYYDIRQEKRNREGSLRPDFSKLRPGLFWDTDLSKIDWQRQKKAVIERIFERGNAEEKTEITRFYGEATIRDFIKDDATHG